MKRLLCLGLLAVSWSALAGRAPAWELHIPFYCSACPHHCCCFGKGGGGGGPQAGPWYLYWPHEAYFQAAAPVGHYPVWPSRMVMPGDAGVNPAAPWTAPAPGVAETVPAPNAAPWTAPPPVPGPAVPDQATSVPGPELVPQSYSYPAGPTYRTPAYWYGR